MWGFFSWRFFVVVVHWWSNGECRNISNCPLALTSPNSSYTAHSSHTHCQLHLYTLLPKSLLYLIPHGNHYRQCLCKSPWWQSILWSPRWHLQTLITSQIHFVCLFEMSTDLIYQPKPCITTQIYIFPGIKRETGERTKWNSI